MLQYPLPFWEDTIQRILRNWCETKQYQNHYLFYLRLNLYLLPIMYVYRYYIILLHVIVATLTSLPRVQVLSLALTLAWIHRSPVPPPSVHYWKRAEVDSNVRDRQGPGRLLRWAELSRTPRLPARPILPGPQPHIILVFLVNLCSLWICSFVNFAVHRIIIKIACLK